MVELLWTGRQGWARFRWAALQPPRSSGSAYMTVPSAERPIDSHALIALQPKTPVLGDLAAPSRSSNAALDFQDQACSDDRSSFGAGPYPPSSSSS